MSDAPKPKPPANKPVPQAPNEKPKFVRRPHLTNRPFQGNEQLAQLKSSLESSMANHPAGKRR